MYNGIIVLAHGSREPETMKTMEEIIRMIKEKTNNSMIRAAFFQFAAPSLEESVCALIEEGISDIRIVPYFLFSGIHIREDIPKVISKLEKEFPNIKLSVSETLGADERLAEIVADRISALPPAASDIAPSEIA